MNILKQSTAATIKLGPFIDDTDGKTAETGLTIAQADIRLSKNGGDFAQTNNTAGATHDENGYYDISLDATDTGTLGRLRVAVSKSGALPVWQDFLVVTANVYDTLCSTDSLDVNVTSLADDVITAAKFDESTAFPLKSADTGSTQVARVGADGDTLETLSDEIAAVKNETAAILEAEGKKQAAILNAEAIRESAIRQAEGQKQAQILQAQGEAEAILSVQRAFADSLIMIREAGADNKVLALKSLEALKTIADGKSTKLIIPADLAGLGGVLAALKDELGIDVGETTADRNFSLDVGRCFGACGLAPVIMIDDDVHQRVKVSRLSQILNQYRHEQEAAPKE